MLNEKMSELITIFRASRSLRYSSKRYCPLLRSICSHSSYLALLTLQPGALVAGAGVLSPAVLSSSASSLAGVVLGAGVLAVRLGRGARVFFGAELVGVLVASPSTGALVVAAGDAGAFVVAAGEAGALVVVAGAGVFVADAGAVELLPLAGAEALPPPHFSTGAGMPNL